MRFAALALALCCCATVPKEIPSSLPYIVVDPMLSGVVASEAAAKVFAIRLRRERAERAKESADLTASLHAAEMRRDAAERYVARNAWWGVYGLPVALGTGIGGAALTAAAFIAAIIFGGK